MSKIEDEQDTELGEASRNEAEAEDPEAIARYRLSILEMGPALGISEVCRRHGVPRQTYYVWKKRYAEAGLQGLKDTVRERKSHPSKTPDEVEAMIESLAHKYPEKSAGDIESLLYVDHGIEISHVTVQKILNRKGLGRRPQRLNTYLEAQTKKDKPGSDANTLRRSSNPKAEALLRRSNPAMRESDENFRPGSQVFQFGFQRRSRARGSGLYVQVIVDPDSAMAWVEIQAKKKHYHAESFLRCTYFDYLKLGIQIRSVVTDNGPEFCSDSLFTWRFRKERETGLVHAYEYFLRSKNIGHDKIVNRHYYHAVIEPRDPDELYEEVVGCDIATQQAHGVVERFYNTLRHEFLDPVLQENPHIDLGELQSQLALWLQGYNETFSHLHEGFPNFGQTPKQRLDEYLQAKAEKAKAANS